MYVVTNARAYKPTPIRNVLSLFDGISCGQLALNRLGISYGTYYASEIDKAAISITQSNFPETIQLGDVQKVDSKNLQDIDLIFAGSPCQGFSKAGHRKNFNDDRSKLFWEFIRLKDELKPKFFLLENVEMDQFSEDVISSTLGVNPIHIDSSHFSAQQRKRVYWTNLPVRLLPLIPSPLTLKDVIDTKATRSWVNVSAIKGFRYGQNYLQYDLSGKGHNSQDQRATYLIRKAPTVLHSNGQSKLKFLRENGDIGSLTVNEIEKLQTLPIDYTKVGTLSVAQRIGAVGNGWTVDVIAHLLSGIK